MNDGDSLQIVNGHQAFAANPRASGVVAANAAGIPAAGLRIWIDAADWTAHDGDTESSAVSPIRDRSGNGVDFFGDSGPTLNKLGLGGLDTFVAGTEGIAHPARANTNFLHQEPSTVFLVAKSSTANAIAECRVFDSVVAAPTGIQLLLSSTHFAVLMYNAGSIVLYNDDGGVAASGDFQRYTARLDPANGTPADRLAIRVDGVDQGIANTYSTAPSGGDSGGLLSMLGLAVDLGALWEGEVAEFIAYDRILSDDECVQVEAYLNRKWFLVAPANIPTPAGGSTVDTEARAALDSILALLADVGLMQS